MVATLAELQCLVAGNEEVVPDLAVSVGQLCQFLYGHVVVIEFVGTVPGVIHEANYFDGLLDGSVRAFVGGSVGVFFIGVKKCAADEEPYHGRVATTLACSKPREFCAVHDKTLGNPQFGLEVVSGLLEGSSLYNADFAVHAILSTSHISQEAWDSVIT
jgi:hypothetical protein